MLRNFFCLFQQNSLLRNQPLARVFIKIGNTQLYGVFFSPGCSQYYKKKNKLKKNSKLFVINQCNATIIEAVVRTLALFHIFLNIGYLDWMYLDDL